ncbi:hypothetical protein J6590_046372 [Homalodisca vitripennis]|nr:hypothetical protein J6590_046372 [Homalodisca vitripennis]
MFIRVSTNTYNIFFTERPKALMGHWPGKGSHKTELVGDSEQNKVNCTDELSYGNI